MKHQYITSRPLSEINPENQNQYLLKSQMYLGVNVSMEIQKPDIQSDQESLNSFYNNCQQFFICACKQIKQRYDFANPILDKLKIFKPRYALGRTGEIRVPSLVPVLTLLPRVCSPDYYQQVDDEWRRLSFYPLDKDLQDLETDVFWGKLLTLKNDAGIYVFENVAGCVLNILSLPHANADCERAFSKINRVKTKPRNRLLVPTVRGIVLASQHVGTHGGCPNFKPSSEMLSRMTKDSLYNKPKNEVLSVKRITYETEEEIEEDDIIFENV